MVNFLNNAINHINEQRIIRLESRRNQETIRISVFNSGQHIPEIYLTEIWKSFYKIDKARTREYGGSGLGLSIVRTIQELHHNEFGVENVEGGVEFWFDSTKKEHQERPELG